MSKATTAAAGRPRQNSFYAISLNYKFDEGSSELSSWLSSENNNASKKTRAEGK